MRDRRKSLGVPSNLIWVLGDFGKIFRIDDFVWWKKFFRFFLFIFANVRVPKNSSEVTQKDTSIAGLRMFVAQILFAKPSGKWMAVLARSSYIPARPGPSVSSHKLFQLQEWQEMLQSWQIIEDQRKGVKKTNARYDAVLKISTRNVVWLVGIRRESTYRIWPAQVRQKY